MPTSTDWSILGGQMGLGALLGFAVGFAAKKALKVALVLLGIVILLGASLQGSGFITVHWPEIETVYTRAMEHTGGLHQFLEDWAHRFGSLLPVTGSFALGFFLGLRKG